MYIEEAIIMISRRNFLKGAGAAALAVAATGVLAGCSDANVPGNTPAPAPSEPETPAAGNTVTLADGVTLTVTGTARKDAGVLQYLAIKFKLNNETAKNVTFTNKNIKAHVNGKWVYPVDADKLTDAQKAFLFDVADAPYIDYYVENNGEAFGTAGTEVEAAAFFQVKADQTEIDVIVDYGTKVFKFKLAI